MKRILLIFFVAIQLSSCTIYRTIHFNADRSGNMETKVDFTALMTMMQQEEGGTNELGSMKDMSSLNNTKTILEGIPGITNVQNSFDTTGIITTSYDFNSVEALVKSMSAGDQTSQMMGMGGSANSKSPIKITYTKKKFMMVEMDKKTLADLKKEGLGGGKAGEMEMALSSSSYNTTIHFPETIRKVSYKNASITNDKSVNFSLPFKEYLSEDYKPLIINFK